MSWKTIRHYRHLQRPMEKDANGILRAIMRVKERPDDIMEKFEQFYHAIDAQEYTLAAEILGNLDEILGDDPDLTAMHIQTGFRADVRVNVYDRNKKRNGT